MVAHNLEDILKGKILDKEGLSYMSFRKKLTPNYLLVWKDILLGYFLLFLGFLAAIYVQLFPIYVQVLSVVFIAAWFGYFVAYLGLFIHEAAHYNIHPNKKTNDILSDLFLGIFIGESTSYYRVTHWEHHKLLGKTTDTENSYFNALTLKFVLETLFLIHAFRIVFTRTKRVQKNELFDEETKKQKTKMLILGIFFNLVILITSFYFSLWVLLFSWVIGMASFFPLFTATRQLLEHRDELASKWNDYFKINHGKYTRLFQNNFFSRLFGGAGFNQHLLHHFDPQISYTNFDELENFLRNTDSCKEIIESSKTTYIHTFILLFNK